MRRRTKDSQEERKMERKRLTKQEREEQYKKEREERKALVIRSAQMMDEHRLSLTPLMEVKMIETFLIYDKYYYICRH